MPVTLVTANHGSRKWSHSQGKSVHIVQSSSELLRFSCHSESRKSKTIIQGSLSQRNFECEARPTLSSSNGFVYAAFDAYNQHHHLAFRPEDVWFSVLSQLSFYINAHAEELRHYFVAHEGKKELKVKALGSIETVDFGYLSRQMATLMQQNVKDPELQAWITPNWSTTSDNDRTVASILMMGSLQSYFSYTMICCCGIPSVTLLGERSDWEDMLERLDKLEELGDEPKTFASLLRPVFRHFVASFEPSPSPSVREFWGKIAHHKPELSGPDYLAGWITAFCFWDEKGKLLYRPNHSSKVCVLDDVSYHIVATKKIPAGYTSVPVLVDDNGVIHHTRMVAGLLGMQLSSSGIMTDNSNKHAGDEIWQVVDGESVLVHKKYVPKEATEPPCLDSLQPVSGWLMYEVKDDAEKGDDYLR